MLDELTTSGKNWADGNLSEDCDNRNSDVVTQNSVTVINTYDNRNSDMVTQNRVVQTKEQCISM